MIGYLDEVIRLLVFILPIMRGYLRHLKLKMEMKRRTSNKQKSIIEDLENIKINAYGVYL